MYTELEEYTDLQATGIIVSEPIEKEYKYVYEVKLQEIITLNNKTNLEKESSEEQSTNEKESNKNLKTQEKVQTKKYSGIKLILNVKKSKDENKILNYGDKILFKLSYERPSQSRNYMGFDYSLYLKTKKIFGTVTLKPTDIKIIKQKQTNFIENSINKLQNMLKTNVYALLPQETAALCMGMLIGDSSEIDEITQENFRNSNLSHILAVSGANVSYIIMAVTYLFNKTSIHKKVSKVLSIFLLLIFMLLTGCTASVNRACIMAISMLIANILYRKSDVYNNLAISAFILLIINPYSLLDIGFQLSYAGTIGIVFFHENILRKLNYVKNKVKDLNNILKNVIFKNTQNKNYISQIIRKDTNKDIKENILFISKNTETKKEKIKSKIFKYIIEMFVVTTCANIAIIPIMMFHFNTISLTFYISNILAGPMLGFVVILGFLMFFVSIICKVVAMPIAFIVNLMLKAIIKIAQITASLPLSKILVTTPHIFFIFIYYLIVYIVVICSPKKLLYNCKTKFKKIKQLITSKNKKVRIITLITIFALIFTSIAIFYVPSTLNKTLKIQFIDVGQGDSCLLITPSKKTILIDGGGSETGSFNIGEKVLLPYLLDRGISKLDYVMFSHFDSDHVQGLLTVLEKLKVQNVIISKQAKNSENFETFLKLVKEKNINVIVANKGSKINIETNIYFYVLWPDSSNFVTENVLNNNSIVCKLYYKKFSMLFTGDIEEIAEKQILELYQSNTKILNSTVLKVAHHGSKTSSTENFLSFVKPKIALIGVGSKNTFGHPSDIVLERFKKYGTKVYRTDKSGEITIKTDGSNIKIRCNL